MTYAVIISADNNDLALLPGMTATARIVIAEKAGVLKVPNAALRFRPPGTGHVTVPSGAGDGRPATVWVLGEDNSPKALGIRIGTADNSAAEVLSGDLHEGQEVIVAAVLTQKKPWVFGLRWGF